MSATIPTNHVETSPELLQVRKLTPLDAQKYNALRLEALRKNPKSFAHSFEDAQLLELPEIEQRLASGMYIGVFDGDSLIGSVTLWKGDLSKMNHKGEVHEMYVDETKRSRGIGKKLLEALFVEAEAQGIQELQLIVWTENSSAVKLYKSMGFKIWGTEQNALQAPDGEYINEYHMARKIGKDAEKNPGDDQIDSGITQIRGDLAAAQSAEKTSMISENGYLDAFKGRENYHESQMQDALVRLHEMISTNPAYASLWEEVWRRSEQWDEFGIKDMLGGTRYAGRWVNISTDYMNEILTKSTFSHLGTQYQVSICLKDAAEGRYSNLLELARHLRSAIETKIFQNAARHISDERNKRLAAAFGLESVHQIIPAHRFQYPSYDVVTDSQLEAYGNGDRGENVFGIGEWTKSDLDRGHLPIAQQQAQL